MILVWILKDVVVLNFSKLCLLKKSLKIINTINATRIIVFLVWMVSGVDLTYFFFYKFIWQGYYNINIKILLASIYLHIPYTNCIYTKNVTLRCIAPLLFKYQKLFWFIYLCMFVPNRGGEYPRQRELPLSWLLKSI